jgi:copper chaperone CopZ
MSAKFKIEGIDCDSCRSLINMELEDAGFTEIKVDSTDQVTVPDEKLADLDQIKTAVGKAGAYKLLD